MNLNKEDVDYIENVLKSAGEIILRYFSKELNIKEKSGAKNILTIADTKSNEYISKKLRERYLDVEFCSEESEYDKQIGEYRFIIDPLEGTSNFALNIPTFVIMIALVSKKECLFSMIYNPLLKTTYYALKGKGAYKNGQKISVNKVNNYKSSSVSTNYSYEFPVDKAIKIDSELRQLGIKRKLDDWCGGYYFCLVAEGKIEAIFSDKLTEYDIIPGIFIAEEAGAKITDWQGNVSGFPYADDTIVSNGLEIHHKLVELLSKI